MTGTESGLQTHNFDDPVKPPHPCGRCGAPETHYGHRCNAVCDYILQLRSERDDWRAKFEHNTKVYQHHNDRMREALLRIRDEELPYEKSWIIAGEVLGLGEDA